ncbi:MAG TPA: hypothetical protein VGM30_20110 [Puia sp.]|jgi:hypothetical protein
MRFFLLACTVIFVGQAWGQSPCNQHSILFKFDQHVRPRLFTEKLGNHPQFPFLQFEKGINTRALFIQAAKDPESRKKYKIEFTAFNELLHEIGFTNGYKDLKAGNVENLFINPGTIGNLGFYNKESNYIYVRLNPAGEADDGIAAWKITGPTGCYFYVLHTCGNAFYANDPVSGGGCCRDVTQKASTDTLSIGNHPHDRPLHIHIRFYQGMRVTAKNHKGYDTVYRLIRSIDTTTTLKDSAAGPSKIYGKEMVERTLVCRDTILSLRIALSADTTTGNKDLTYTLSDTSYITTFTGKSDCRKGWEISLDGGGSVNSVPNFDNTAEHARTNGIHMAGELAVSRIFNHWFQAGVSASYIILSYQDDLPYPGSAAGVYNSVYLGVPIIPVQLFGKATIGGPLGWQSNISLSAGWSIPTHDNIMNSGNTLTTKPAVKGGPTAGFKLGIAYFFSCKFGIGASFDGQYFNNKSATMNYQLAALPVTLGIRYRFGTRRKP